MLLAATDCVCNRTENLTEMDLFIESHKYFLANKTKSEIFYPHSKDGLKVHVGPQQLVEVSKLLSMKL